MMIFVSSSLVCRFWPTWRPLRKRLYIELHLVPRRTMERENAKMVFHIDLDHKSVRFGAPKFSSITYHKTTAFSQGKHGIVDARFTLCA